mgnify:CR=1 FL=1
MTSPSYVTLKHIRQQVKVAWAGLLEWEVGRDVKLFVALLVSRQSSGPP